MIDFELMIEEEFDEFYEESKRHKNLKMLIEFEGLDTQYNSKEFKLDKPKMKKKLTANKWIPKSNNKSQLF
jgi:hypothetical protein